MPTYNMFSPYGATGPQYNMDYSVTPGGVRKPDRPGDNRWSQGLNPQANEDASQKYNDR